MKIKDVVGDTDELFAEITAGAKELGIKAAIIASMGFGIEFAGAIQEAVHQAGLSGVELADYIANTQHYINEMEHAVKGTPGLAQWVAQAKFMLENPSPFVSGTLQKVGAVTTLCSPVLASASLLVNDAYEALHEWVDKVDHRMSRRM